MKNKLCDLLKIEKGITSIIGGGGKTTLMMTLAKELLDNGTVIIATSTKILKPEFCETLLNPTCEEITKALLKNKVICVASVHESGKLTSPSISFAELNKLADYVIVEADGSKQLPIKAHAIFEPVIPKESNQTIYVIGIDGLGKKISGVCHRPEIFSSLTGCGVNDVLTTALLSQAINMEALADRFYINKIACQRDWNMAKELADYLNKPVVAGSLLKEEYKCLS